MSCPHGNDPETCSFCLQVQSYMVNTAAEDKRIERWHATYNAALQGLMSQMEVHANADAQLAHEFRARLCMEAMAFATMTHGPLEKP